MAAAQHAAKKELPQHTVKKGLSWQILVVIAIASALLVLGGLLGFHYLSRCSTVDCVEARSAASHITFHSNSSNGDCSSALQIPQVALLFLTRGELWHEPTWMLWFKAAEGLLPLDALRKTNCNATFVESIQQRCSVSPGTQNPIRSQHLFDVHIHTAPSYQGFPAESMFHGREVPNRIDAKWGTHLLIEAARALFAEALKNPHNQRFVMLSESGIPLYSPLLIWQQLMSETKSRINACQHPWMDTWRWHAAMNRGQHRVPMEGWRKSSQWMGLIRDHAEIFVNDTVIDELFKAYCVPSNACYSDEHYVPTLLAYLGKDQETDCWGFLVNVDWSRGGAHPRTYAVEDIDAERIRALRIPDMCHFQGANKLAKQMFVPARALAVTTCAEDSVWSDKLMDFHCPLFARKFPNATALPVRDLLADCSNRLEVTACLPHA